MNKKLEKACEDNYQEFNLKVNKARWEYINKDAPIQEIGRPIFEAGFRAAIESKEVQELVEACKMLFDQFDPEFLTVDEHNETYEILKTFGEYNV